jgi:hypothetical protein
VTYSALKSRRSRGSTIGTFLTHDRLLSLQLETEYKLEFEGILRKASMFKAELVKVRNDPRLPIILRYILSIGNYLNGGSVRGGIIS